MIGEDFKTVEKLGSLYFEAGRKDDALACGKRLFSAIHKDEDDKDKDEQEENRYRYYYADEDYYWEYQQQQANSLSQLIGAIQEYFSSKGLNKEFGALIAAEAKLQPKNQRLLDTAVAHLVETDKEGAKAIELVEGVRAATVAKGDIPKNTTALEFEDYLEQKLNYIFGNSSKVVDLRIGELKGAVEAASRPSGAAVSDRKVVNLADLLDMNRKEADAKAVLEGAVAREPKSILLLAALANRNYRDKEYEAAADLYSRLLVLLPQPGQTEERAKRIERDFRRSRRDMLNRFPVTVRKRVSAGDLKRVFDLQTPPTSGSPRVWAPSSRSRGSARASPNASTSSARSTMPRKRSPPSNRATRRITTRAHSWHPPTTRWKCSTRRAPFSARSAISTRSSTPTRSSRM